MLGDDTAQRQGRVTLNPLSHLDPIGSIGILFLVVGGFGIGWGRPVPISPSRLRGQQRGMGVTAIAGPISNVVLAAIFVIPLRFGNVAEGSAAYVFMRQIVVVNLLLAAFNMIPIPPLDGSKILTGLLPRFWYPYLAPLEQYGAFILLALILFGSLGSGILSAMYSPVYNGLNCTKPDGTACQDGDTNCTCTSFVFASCRDKTASARTITLDNGMTVQAELVLH